MSRNWGSKKRGMEVPGKKEVTKNHVFSRRPRGSGRPCFPGCLRDFCCICDNSQTHSPAVTVRRGTSPHRFSSWAPHEKPRPQSGTSRGQSPPSHIVPVMLASALWASRNFLFGKKKWGSCVSHSCGKDEWGFSWISHTSLLCSVSASTELLTRCDPGLAILPSGTPPPPFPHQLSQLSGFFWCLRCFPLGPVDTKDESGTSDHGFVFKAQTCGTRCAAQCF